MKKKERVGSERGNAARYWCFTINNPPAIAGGLNDNNPPGGGLLERNGPIVCDALFREKVEFMSYQLEKGEAGTPHLQGYIVLKEKARFQAFAKLSPLFVKAHFEVCKGGVKANVAYTTKEEGRVAGPWVYGDEPEEIVKGKRTDLLAIKSAVVEGKRQRDLWTDDKFFPTMLRYHKSIDTFISYSVPERNFKTKIVVFYGETGCGKSYSAKAEYPNSYYVPHQKSGGITYWDKYSGQESVIVEEMGGGRFSHSFLKDLCDKGPVQVPFHGGLMEFNSKVLVFTSPVHPYYWYEKFYEEKPEEWKQMRRRFDEVRVFTEPFAEEDVAATEPSWYVIPPSKSNFKRIEDLDKNRQFY